MLGFSAWEIIYNLRYSKCKQGWRLRRRPRPRERGLKKERRQRRAHSQSARSLMWPPVSELSVPNLPVVFRELRENCRRRGGGSPERLRAGEGDSEWLHAISRNKQRQASWRQWLARQGIFLNLKLIEASQAHNLSTITQRYKPILTFLFPFV